MPENEIVVKTDDESVLSLCNSLNAWQGPMRRCGHHRVADLLLEAQQLITKLTLENHRLKDQKEDHE